MEPTAQKVGRPMSENQYVARIVDVPGEGVRLEPTAESTTPEQPTEVNLLGMSIALALGAAGYEHHPEPRNPQAQTIDALLAGLATMPWRATTVGPEAVPYIVCGRSDAGISRCEVHYRPVE
jgi:hypothetical protein